MFRESKGFEDASGVDPELAEQNLVKPIFPIDMVHLRDRDDTFGQSL